MKREARMALIEGVDTSNMTKREIGKILGSDISYASVRKFISTNKIPYKHSKVDNSVAKTVITKDMMMDAIDTLARTSHITYEELGKKLGFSKQRALSLCQKYDLNEEFKLAKKRAKQVAHTN